MMNADSSSPKKKKTIKTWLRIIDIILRTAHVAVISVIFGGAFFGVTFERVIPCYYFVFITGSALIVSEICYHTSWIHQGRGIMAVIHIGLLGIVYMFPDIKVPVLALVIVFGMTGSHMPKKLRYWSFIRGQLKD